MAAETGSSTEPLGLDTEEGGPWAFRGAGRGAAELIRSIPVWNESLNSYGNGAEEAARSREDVGPALGVAGRAG